MTQQSIMTNLDAIVAEAVGYTLHEPYQPQGTTSTKMWKARECPPFISAPTYETDGIVLEWVQRQGNLTKAKFYTRARKLLAPKDYYSNIAFLVGQVLLNYRPGMYAKALLAVEEERGE